LTYGDGLSNVNNNQVVQFHIDNKKLATVSAVHPVARFGELSLNEEAVTSFAEKPQTSSGWINGGFFVMEPECLNYIENDQTVLEKYPLSKLAEEGNLGAFRHDGFWQCMDTRRDRNSLEESWISGSAPWKT
jgi:glucose-1-phosphate cytidylyltransferase